MVLSKHGEAPYIARLEAIEAISLDIHLPNGFHLPAAAAAAADGAGGVTAAGVVR